MQRSVAANAHARLPPARAHRAFRPVCHAHEHGAAASQLRGVERALLAGFAASIVMASGVGDAAANVIAGPARVVDGDTLVVSGERIRLYGVDAPESAQQCVDAGGKSYPCGLVSKDALAKKVGSAAVRCDVKTTDQYGRNVAVCGLGAEDLNAWLVSNGYAVAYRQYGKEYIPLEDAAHAARKGVWQGQFQMPSEWRKQNKRSEAGPVQPSVPFTPPPLAAAGIKPAGGDPVPSCGATPAIKGNISSSGEKIYHVPGGKYYASVRIDLKDGEKFFCSEGEAKAAGWRASSQ